MVIEIVVAVEEVEVAIAIVALDGWFTRITHESPTRTDKPPIRQTRARRYQTPKQRQMDDPHARKQPSNEIQDG